MNGRCARLANPTSAKVAPDESRSARRRAPGTRFRPALCATARARSKACTAALSAGAGLPPVRGHGS